ncbi:hypothetical protein V1477_020993 [Vespula maculifrons]|uniref:Uncharacterized protein n=1 Tax=Vespula maculifrons TaxID=7453 RepID=A0ABD2ANH9_VESMC
MCYVFVTLTKCDPRRFNVPGFALGSCKDDTSMEFNNPQLVRIIEVVGIIKSDLIGYWTRSPFTFRDNPLFRHVIQVLIKGTANFRGRETRKKAEGKQADRQVSKNLENIAAHNLRHTYSRMKGSDIRLNLNDSRWTAMSTRSTPYRTMISNRLSRVRLYKP